MPKCAITRSVTGSYATASHTGHNTQEFSLAGNLAAAAVTYATSAILKETFPESSVSFQGLAPHENTILIEAGIDVKRMPSAGYGDMGRRHLLSGRIMSAAESTGMAADEKISAIQDDYNSREATLIAEYEARIRDLEASGGDCGLPEEDILILYERFVSVYVDKGAHYLPSMNEFQKYYAMIDERLSQQETQDFRLKLYRDMLKCLIESKSSFFENKKLEKEISALRRHREEAKEKIISLTRSLAECNPSGGGQNFSGSVSLKIRKPKQLIYAQALLNINMAWYVYLHDTTKVDAGKYMNTVTYVNQLGADAYDTLISLLDEKYASIEDLLDNVDVTANTHCA